MAEDARSVTNRRRKRFVVVNPGPDSDEDEDRKQHSFYGPYNPPPLPSPRSPFAHKPPTPLTTNLPPDPGHRSQSSHSNPALSSPSSTSSPAVESTPPPSTPGLVSADPPYYQEPTVGVYDRNDSPQSFTPRSGNLLGKIKSHWLHSSHHSRASNRSNTSPTTSLNDSSSSTSYTIRSSDKVLIVVTQDSDQYRTVDISGAADPAFIRERIFTRLEVSDENQSKFSIYQTEIGAFAQGDALTDEALFDICRERGDSRGTLKFFVTYSSALVHEPIPRSTSSVSPTVNTIPPPVLPYSGGGYRPLHSKRDSGSRHGSVSSASERLPPEVSAGYEASVSDDSDNPERDTNRATLRPPPQQANPTSTVNTPPSPGTTRRPYGPPPRPSSPLSGAMSPEHARPRRRLDKYGSIVIPAGPPPLSPSVPTFSGTEGTPARESHVRSGSDTIAEYDQVARDSEEQTARGWRLPFCKEEKPKEQAGAQLQRSKVYLDRSRSQYDDGDDDKQEREKWTGPYDVPRAATLDIPLSHSSSRSSPSLLRTPRRERDYPPARPPPNIATKRPPIPNAPRNPPPPVPRSTGQTVLPMWAVTYKGPDKVDQKAPPTSSQQWSRLTAKSMDNLRHAYKHNTNHPANLQPGGNMRRLPMTRPSVNNLRDRLYPPSDNRGGNIPPMPKLSDLTTRNSVYNTAGPGHLLPRPPPLQSPSQSNLDFSQSPLNQFGSRGAMYSPAPSGTMIHAGLGTTLNDPFPRPSSAVGDTMVSPPSRYQRQQQTSLHGTDSEASQDAEGSRSPRALSPQNIPYRSKEQLGKNDIPWTAQQPGDFASKLNSIGPYVERSSSESSSSLHQLHTPPRSPASPHSPRFVDRQLTSTSDSTVVAGDAMRNANMSRGREDSITSEGTVKQEDRHWIARMFSNQTNSESTLIPRAEERTEHSKIPSPPSYQADSALSPASDSQTPTMDDDSDSENDGSGTLWAVPMTEKQSPPRPKSILRGPQLKVRIETPSNSSMPSTAHSQVYLPSNFPPPPSIPPPPLPLPMQRRAGSNTPKNTKGHRESTFTEMHTYTWAPRPPPEDVYERLEDFFPEHDLDKPVIDASSGGTSPTTADYSVPPPVNTNVPDKSRIKGKKSIRIVAEEHKKRIDRTSRSDSSTITSVMRKRSTKLWGSKLEEVTTAQAKNSLNVAVPESPQGGPKPIFKWVRGELIGRGTYGRVYLALNATTGEMIAVKQVEMPRTASDKSDSRQVTVVEALKLESETLKDLDHPNIVQYLGFEETPKFLSIFLEYVPGGSVGSCLRKHGKFDQAVTKSFTAQILSGLEYLHSKGILHRDLKADNILVETSGVCKISDFGISKRTDDINGQGAFTAMQGSVFWMAPEVINTQKKGYNAKVDIWSVGCVVLEMWAGERPWSEEEAVAVMFKLYQNKVPPPLPPDVILSEDALDFRGKCFATNPEERPTAAELRKHPYLILPPGWVFTEFK